MMPFTFHPLLLLVGTLITAACSLALALQLRRIKTKLTQCRTELTRIASASAPDEITEPQEKPRTPDFNDSLLQATLKQRLQNGPEWRQPPEKYGYAAALADQGMDAEGIAAVLQFPIEAAQQLIALKRAAQIDPSTAQPDK